MSPATLLLTALALPAAAPAQAPAPRTELARFPAPARDDLVEALRAWIGAVGRGDGPGMQAAAGRVEVVRADLATQLGHDPLTELAAWSDALGAALGPAAPPPPGWLDRTSARFGQPYRLWSPPDAPAGRLPLLILLGTGDGAPPGSGTDPVAFPPGHLVLRLDLPSAAFEEVLADGRRRFLDAFAEVLRLAPVDRNRIHLVARPGAGIAATLLGGAMPHFFDLVALGGPAHWWAGWPWQESVGRALRSFAQLAPHLTLPGLLDPSWTTRLDLRTPPRDRPRQVELVRLLQAARGNLLAPGGREEVGRGGEGSNRAERFLAFSDLPSALAWCATAAPRDSAPAAISFRLLQPGSGRSFWAQATSFEPEGDREGPSGFEIRADRARNRLVVVGEGIHSLDLYLNDRLLDLARPIEIVLADADLVLHFEARRSLSTLLENFARNPDPGALYPAMIRGLDLPPAPR